MSFKQYILIKEFLLNELVGSARDAGTHYNCVKKLFTVILQRNTYTTFNPELNF